MRGFVQTVSAPFSSAFWYCGYRGFVNQRQVGWSPPSSSLKSLHAHHPSPEHTAPLHCPALTPSAGLSLYLCSCQFRSQIPSFPQAQLHPGPHINFRECEFTVRTLIFIKPLSPFQGRPGRGHRKQAPRASDRDGSDSLQPLTSQLRRDSASWIRPSNTDLLLRAHFLSLSSPSDLGLWGSARVSVTTRRLTDVFLTVVGTLRSSGHC